MDAIPQELKERKQWCVWRHVAKEGKPVKVPFQVTGECAKSTDPSTWCSFYEARSAKGYEGLGFILSEDDPYTGIDIDGCYDKETKVLSDWARKIIDAFQTYAELSPSGSGVKLIARGTFPLPTGKNKKLDLPAIGGKSPGIEMYGSRRFFALTGLCGGAYREIRDCQSQIDRLATHYWPNEMSLVRASKYVEKIPPAISGQGGDKLTYKTACILVKGFGLDESQALQVLREYNSRAEPAWTEKELVRKVRAAQRASGPVGYLRDAQDMASVKIPEYECPDIGEALQICINALDTLNDRGCRTVIAGLKEMYR